MLCLRRGGCTCRTNTAIDDPDATKENDAPMAKIRGSNLRPKREGKEQREKEKKGKKGKKEKNYCGVTTRIVPRDLSQLKRFFLEGFRNSGILTVLLTAIIWNSRYLKYTGVLVLYSGSSSCSPNSPSGPTSSHSSPSRMASATSVPLSILCTIAVRDSSLTPIILIIS